MLTNRSVTDTARPMVERLSRFVDRPEILSILKESQARVAQQLRRDPALPAAVENIDLTELADPPSGIGSIRVAVIRAGFDGGNERHPNSTQYLFSLEGRGQTHVKEGSGWREDSYGQGARVEDRFHVVSEGVWHRSAASGPEDWTVVAFHTAEQVQDDYDYPE